MTCADHLLDNHMVISEHRKSCNRKMSAQSAQKMGFEKIIRHIRESTETLFVHLLLND